LDTMTSGEEIEGFVEYQRDFGHCMNSMYLYWSGSERFTA
jgi:hypothetical protein